MARRSNRFNVCHRGNEEIVQLLLQARADLNIKDQHGSTALTFAIRNDHNEITQILKQAGAKQ